MFDEIEIRPIMRSDNERIARIIKNVLIEFDGDKPGTAFHDESLLNMFESYKKETEQYFVALLNGELIGGCGIKPLQDGNSVTCELQKMYIGPKGRGKKIGKKLLDYSINFAKETGYSKCYIETFSSMLGALNLYIKNDFYYIHKPLGSTGHDACNTWMLKDLN